MLIIRSGLLNKFPEIIFGFSTKIGLKRNAPYFFNTSLSVNDSTETVLKNRAYFYKKLGLNNSSIVTQKQVHGQNIALVKNSGDCGETDALITDKFNLGLAVSSADCPTIFLYDPVKKNIAAVHSGWRGTEKKILLQTLIKLEENFNSSPSNIVAYISPSISRKNYEVGEEVAALFDDKYSIKKKSKHLLDLQSVNKDIMIKFGLINKNIQVSSLCSFEMNNFLHSFRRDGSRSGRSFGIIAMRNIQ